MVSGALVVEVVVSEALEDDIVVSGALVVEVVVSGTLEIEIGWAFRYSSILAVIGAGSVAMVVLGAGTVVVSAASVMLSEAWVDEGSGSSGKKRIYFSKRLL